MQKQMVPRKADFIHLNLKYNTSGQVQVAIPMHSKEWEITDRVSVLESYGASGEIDAPLFREAILEVPGSITPSPIFVSDYPIIISGKSMEAVKFHCHVLGALLSRKGTTINLADVAYNLAIRQNRGCQYSLTFVTCSIEQLQSDLKRTMFEATALNEPRSQEPYIVLCFGGQEGHTAHLSKVLYDSSLLLQHHLHECSLVCMEKLSLPSLFPTIFSPEPIQDIVTLHCILFSIQYACAKSWLDCGLKVDRMIGYSFGQLTALCVAGSLSLFEALRLVSKRAQLVREHENSRIATMLTVEVSDIGRLLWISQQQHPGFSADIACYNGPHNYVVIGDEMSIQAIEKASENLRTGSRSMRLANRNAFQSRLLDDILPELLQVATELDIKPLQIPIEACSNVDDWSEITPAKIVRHSRQAVHFMEAVRRVEQRAKGSVTWLEAGSGSAIIPMIERAVFGSDERNVYIATPLRYDANAQLNLAKATSRLWSCGIRTQFWPFYSS